MPEYLAAIPPDPYDGKPLRYSNEKRWVWSIGKDRRDDGGSDPGDDDGRVDLPDPTFVVGTE